MRLSKIRFSEIESLPDNAIDTSDIPELDDGFWKTLSGLSQKITFRSNKRYWSGSRDKVKITTLG